MMEQWTVWERLSITANSEEDDLSQLKGDDVAFRIREGQTSTGPSGFRVHCIGGGSTIIHAVHDDAIQSWPPQCSVQHEYNHHKSVGN